MVEGGRLAGVETGVEVILRGEVIEVCGGRGIEVLKAGSGGRGG